MIGSTVTAFFLKNRLILNFRSYQNSLLCIVRELAGSGAVAVAMSGMQTWKQTIIIHKHDFCSNKVSQINCIKYHYHKLNVILKKNGTNALPNCKIATILSF